MGATVEFDDQHELVTKKVGEVARDRLLPAPLVALPISSQQWPQSFLHRRLVSAQFAGSSERLRTYITLVARRVCHVLHVTSERIAPSPQGCEVRTHWSWRYPDCCSKAASPLLSSLRSQVLPYRGGAQIPRCNAFLTPSRLPCNAPPRSSKSSGRWSCAGIN